MRIENSLMVRYRKMARLIRIQSGTGRVKNQKCKQQEQTTMKLNILVVSPSKLQLN